MFKVILTILICIMITGIASATDYYVATDGNNTNNGTIVNPWKTITYAATQAYAGDTVYIKGGHYGHEHVVSTRSGTASEPIVFKGYDGTPVLDGQDWTGNGWLISNKNYITVDGIKIINYLEGIVLSGKYITINNNVFEENGDAGCRLFGATSENITFSYNEFYDYNNGKDNQQDYGLQLYYASNITATNNYFYGEGHQDISLKHSITNAYIANNTFEGFYYTAIYLGQEAVGARTSNVIVENNTFRSVSGYRANDAIVLRFVDDVIIRNNFMDGASHSGINIYMLDYDKLPIVPTPQNAEIYENIIINTIGTRPAACIELVGAFNNWTIYNNVFFNSTAGLYILNASGNGNVLKNNIISQTDYQVYWQNSYPGSVFFSHDYNNWFPSWTYAGPNSISTDPLFVDASNSDFHLKSQYGRWDDSGWVYDGVTSPGVDAGDSASDYSNEPTPNGERINIGAYGNTPYASKSASSPDLPPTASAGPDHTTSPGTSITFDGSPSTDDNGITSYVWDFGDSQNATGVEVTHTYDTAGTYTVTLTVTDTGGNTDSDTTIITVSTSIATPVNKDPVLPEYWNYYEGTGSGDWGRTTDEAHTGNYSAFLKGTEYNQDNLLNIGLVVGDSNGYSGLNAYNATPDTTYNISFWIKGDFNYINVYAMTWNTEDGSSGRTLRSTSIGQVTPTGTWTQYQGTFTIPSDAKKLILMFKVYGDSSQINLGTIYVDDVEICASPNIVLNPGAENSQANNEPPLNSIVSITPSTSQTTPGETFTLTIPITPATPITGAQFDLLFDGSMATITTVTEGNLLNQDDATILFNSGTIDNAAGTVTNIYGSILGATSVSSQGSLATISMTAGGNTGYLYLNLSNVVISDANSAAVPYTLTNASVLIDTAPILDSIGAKSVDEENALAFTASASDADGDSLTYSAANLPTGASFNTATGAFSWAPADGQDGIYVVTFEVTDSYLSDSETVTITVNDANHAPVITTFVPENSLIYNELDVITIGIIASDADGQALSYTIKIDGVTQSTSSSYVWETDYSSAGIHTIDITVSDGIDQVTDQRTITINDVHPRWDVNEDGTVNVLDISIIGQKYGASVEAPYPRWDVNQDGAINVQDMTLAAYYFGETVV